MDPDIWYRSTFKPTRFDYYEYKMCYVDDIMCISHDPSIVAVFKFKGDNMDQPKIYIGAQVGNMIVDGAEGWYMSVEKNARAAVDNVEQDITKSNQCLPTRCKTPIMYGYWPETDTSPDLNDEGVTQYKELFRVIRWAFELGWIDILLETELMSTYLDLSCRGHFKQIFHVFGYLKVILKRKLCFDPQNPKINKRSFAAHNWYDFYQDTKGAIPADSPTPRGDVVSTHCFVDTEHSGNRSTRRS